jgi:outer membrane protein OmpA-like peptidoglycan-associated protein
MKSVTLSTLALVLVASTASAQGTATSPPKPVSFPSGDRDGGTFASTILGMGISPRAVGLAEAMGAIDADPADIWYNAAGLARLKTNAIIATGSQRFVDTQLAGVAVTFPTTLATFAVGARAFNAGTIDEVENNVLLGSRCRAYQLALQGGGAMELASHFLIGGSLFYAQETLCQQSAGTIGVNMSALAPDIWNRLTLGAGIQNWGNWVTFVQESARPPFFFYVAGAYDALKHRNLLQTPMLFRGEPIVLDAKVVGQIDFIEHHDDMVPALGVEATVNGVAIGRIGFQWGGDNRKGLTLGAGINVGQFRLEYGFRDRRNTGTSFFASDPIGDEHHVSATFFWGGPNSNQPVVPVIVTQPIDTAAINAAVRDAMARELDRLRPLLDSLKAARVEIVRDTVDLVSRYVVPIHFGFDSTAVRDTDVVVLGQIAEIIKKVYPSALVTIEGFADPAGTPAYNLELSRRRSAAVKRVMVERFGLPDAQLKTIGYGEQFARQVAPGARRNDFGAAENRRVTFTIDATRHF